MGSYLLIISDTFFTVSSLLKISGTTTVRTSYNIPIEAKNSKLFNTFVLSKCIYLSCVDLSKALTSSITPSQSLRSSGISLKSLEPLLSIKQVNPKELALVNRSIKNSSCKVHSPPDTVMP